MSDVITTSTMGFVLISVQFGCVVSEGGVVCKGTPCTGKGMQSKN